MQAARLHLPLLGDLRRGRLDLRLRPLRRAAEEQRQGRVVAVDAAGARRHRRDRLGDHPAPAGVGGVGAPRRVHRPAGRLQDLQAALSRRQARGLAVRAEAVQAPGRGTRLRAHRGARVQPHVRDPRRARCATRPRSPTCAPRPRRGSSSTSRTCSSSRASSRRSGSRRSASRFATRSRPATSSSAPASSSRWRWSSSSRPTRPSAGIEHWMDERMRWYTDLGIRPDNLILRAHGADELSHYSSATSDIEYLFPMGWSELEGIAEPRRLRPHPARRALRREARVLRPADQGALRPARDRAGRRGRPGDARVHRRRLRHRGGRGPPAHRAPPAPAARAGQGRGAAAGLPGGNARARARDLRRRSATGSRPSSTRAARSASATAARTRSAPRGG